MDERIARAAAQEARRENPPNLENDEITINERLYRFERVSLFDGKLRIYLPEDFSEMPEEIARIKYPSSDRPKIIVSDERGAATFTFGIVESPLDKASLSSLVFEMRTMLHSLNPSWIFFEKEEGEDPKPNAESFSYKSTAADGTVYNLMFFAPADEKTMMGTFSCPYGEHEAWESVLHEILRLVETGEERAEE
jgi:hypothetical protein